MEHEDGQPPAKRLNFTSASGLPRFTERNYGVGSAADRLSEQRTSPRSGPQPQIDHESPNHIQASNTQLPVQSRHVSSEGLSDEVEPPTSIIRRRGRVDNDFDENLHDLVDTSVASRNVMTTGQWHRHHSELC
jgi:hypothetical protein